MAEAVLGIIGGSGIYNLPEFESFEKRIVDTPWGEPSDALRIGKIDNLKIVFLPRHGGGHVVPPGEINYRANIDAMKRCGVTDLISVSACGSFREKLAPGTFVFVDQFIDRTNARESSFFGKGCVAHVSMAHPTSPLLVEQLTRAAEQEHIDHQKGGTYVAMEGPQFSSLAESLLYKSWNCDVIGMTNMPEAKLAREAEICYATCAMVTDYDCWHEDHEKVEVADIVRVMASNGDKAARLVKRFIADMPREHQDCPVGSDRALEYAIITAEENRDPAMLAKLDAVAGRVL